MADLRGILLATRPRPRWWRGWKRISWRQAAISPASPAPAREKLALVERAHPGGFNRSPGLVVGRDEQAEQGSQQEKSSDEEDHGAPDCPNRASPRHTWANG